MCVSTSPQTTLTRTDDQKKGREQDIDGKITYIYSIYKYRHIDRDHAMIKSTNDNPGLPATLQLNVQTPRVVTGLQPKNNTPSSNDMTAVIT